MAEYFFLPLALLSFAFFLRVNSLIMSLVTSAPAIGLIIEIWPIQLSQKNYCLEMMKILSESGSCKCKGLKLNVLLI